MMKPVLIAAALAAAAPALPSAAFAQTNDFAMYDVSQAETLAEKLVVCDRARLFENPPNPDAIRTYVKVDPSRFELALPPDFTRPSGWYDYDIERTYDRLRHRGLVTRAEVDAAQAKYEAPLLRRTELPTVSERNFLRRQSDACTTVLREARRR